MSLNKILVFLAVCAAIIGVWVFSPGVRHSVKSWFQTVKEDIGPSEPEATVGSQAKVFVPRGDAYYHVRDCPLLEGKTGIPWPLDKARELYRPCPECNPPR